MTSFIRQKSRIKAGLTQTELGKRANINHRSISSYEKGGNFPRKDNLNRLDKALDLTTEYLLGNEVDTADGVEGLRMPGSSKENVKFLRIYSVALTTTEVIGNYRAGL